MFSSSSAPTMWTCSSARSRRERLGRTAGAQGEADLPGRQERPDAGQHQCSAAHQLRPCGPALRPVLVVNASGGLLGRKVKLIFLDDKSDPTQGSTNVQQLISSDHVDLLFGPFSSLITAPTSTVAARYGYAMIEGAGGAPAVFNTPSNQAKHNVFDVSYP